MCNIVYVLYAYKFILHLVKVVDEGAVTGGAEKEGSIGLAERLVLHIHGKGVCGLVLEGEMDVVLYAVAFLIGRFNLSDSLLKQSLVLRGDSDGKVAGAVGVAHVFLGFHKVLCDCGANFLRITVELEEGLLP